MANERRLIDLNELGIGRCNPDVFPLNNRGYCAGWNGVIALLNGAPTVNAVEVVRCGECEHQRMGGNAPFSYLFCMGHEDAVFRVEPNDFCSRGKRRDENDD